MNIVYVYVLQYPCGIPFYIGIGRGDRFKQHFYKSDQSDNKLKKNVISAIRSSGQEPLVKKLFENLYEDEAEILEKLFIKHYGTIINETGILTNLTNGGEASRNHLYPSKSIKFFSKEEIDQRKRKFFPGKMSEEKRKNISNSMQNKKIVIQYSLNYDFIKTFESINDATRNTGILSSNIRKACNMERKSAGGYIWKFQ